VLRGKTQTRRRRHFIGHYQWRNACTVAGDASGLILQFDVINMGIGIPPEQCEKIFEVFAQADMSTTRKFGGTGFGLAISERLVRLMGGSISVQSEPGRGSHFTFSIRVQHPSESAPTSSASRASFPRRAALIVAEKEKDAVLVSRFLRDWGIGRTPEF
jgi:two-component system sensor histidine kinase/response regulator